MKSSRNKKIAAMTLSMTIVVANASGSVFAAPLKVDHVWKQRWQEEASWSMKNIMADISDISGSAVNTPQPSVSPSQIPSTEPSQRPSAEPTQRPGAEPSQRPSAEPTQKPGGRPSEYPEVSAEPVPTASESVKPPEDTAKPSPSEGAFETKTPVPIVSSKPSDSSEPVVSSEPGQTGEKPDGTPADGVTPTKTPDNNAPAGNYMPGDANVLPGLFKDSGQDGNSGSGTSGNGTYWGSYVTVYSSSDQVVMPGILSDVLRIEKKTSRKESKNVKWGDARTKKLNAMSKNDKAQETIPETGDSTHTEWIFPALTGSAAVLAMCLRKKEETE